MTILFIVQSCVLLKLTLSLTWLRHFLDTNLYINFSYYRVFFLTKKGFYAKFAFLCIVDFFWINSSRSSWTVLQLAACLSIAAGDLCWRHGTHEKDSLKQVKSKYLNLFRRSGHSKVREKRDYKIITFAEKTKRWVLREPCAVYQIKCLTLKEN